MQSTKKQSPTWQPTQTSGDRGFFMFEVQRGGDLSLLSRKVSDHTWRSRSPDGAIVASNF